MALFFVILLGFLMLLTVVSLFMGIVNTGKPQQSQKWMKRRVVLHACALAVFAVLLMWFKRT